MTLREEITPHLIRILDELSADHQGLLNKIAKKSKRKNRK